MDRRQRKTRNAIFQAFTRLLEKKTYSALTVQEIIDEADISRPSRDYFPVSAARYLCDISRNICIRSLTVSLLMIRIFRENIA